MEEAALAAGVSKRTAYRYFTSQEHLLADAALETLRPRIDALMRSVAASNDVHARVRALAVELRRLAEEHDAELREMIRASLDRAPVPPGDAAPRQRGGRRLDWIRLALAPVQNQLSTSGFAAATNALAVCLGIDALIVLRDICGLSGETAEHLMVWMADAVLDRTLAQDQREQQ